MVSSSSSSAPEACSSRSCTYHVFLSFRGEDTRKTFVDHFYSALVNRQIHTYKDDETLPRGELIGPSLFKAIEESQIAVIIFSKNYADSSWCLKELEYIIKCKYERGLIVIPIFYDVEPSEVRNQNGKFGEAFAKQVVKNNTKAGSWRQALVDASEIAGWEPKNMADGHESKTIKEIVDTLFDRLFSLDSHVDEDLVGMTTRLKDLKSQLDMRSNDVRMVGIWGVGGSGKTTLATSFFMEISHHFQGHCIVENIREESSDLKKLQENILSSFSEKEVKVHSVLEGKHKIKSMVCRRKVLLLLDDVDKLSQLDALAGSHNWFGSGSLILITTRDEHLLTTHKIDELYRVRLLLKDEAIQLFKKHAYNEKHPVEAYETLSLSVISYADGLPLALKVLGSFLYDKDKKGWTSTLARLKDIPKKEIVEKLKISYDGLETVEKELFLDIACFFRGESKDKAIEILEALGFYPKIGIEVLRQKALITIMNGRFNMHDLIQEMGHYIVRGEHPNNPEKHSRVWKHEEITNMCYRDVALVKDNETIEAISYHGYSHGSDISSGFCNIISNMKKLRLLMVGLSDSEYGGPNFISCELRYIDWHGYPASPFPYSFQPIRLVVLKLWRSMQKELWSGLKHLPHLKVLKLEYMKKLISTPNFYGLPRLQKLTISCCEELEEIHSSLGNHTSLKYLRVSRGYKLRMFPTIVDMKNLKTLEIEAHFLEDGELPSRIGELTNLQELNLSGNDFSLLDFSISQLTRLKILNLSDCKKLLVLPDLPSSLTILKADYCNSLTSVDDCYINCNQLCQVSLMEGSIITDGGRLLESMLEGKPIENGLMILQLEGIEIPKGFTPRLLRGSRCRLQLPENWCNDFSGFLMCAILTNDFYSKSNHISISMNHAMSDMDSDDVFWEERNIDSDKYTWVGYVSFDSLRHTTWWDPTHEDLSFEIEDKYKDCNGFRVILVSKKSSIDLTENKVDEKFRNDFGVGLADKKSKSDLKKKSADKKIINKYDQVGLVDKKSKSDLKEKLGDDYAPGIEIRQDTTSTLTISLSFYDPYTSL